MSSEVETSLESLKSGFSLRVPLMDTTIYLDYLAARFLKAGGEINANVRFRKLEDVDQQFELSDQLCRNRRARTCARRRSRATSRAGRDRAENRTSFLRDSLR